jgi:hypothetical protein
MKNFVGKGIKLAVLVAFAASFSTAAFAEESNGNPVTSFFKRLFNYPSKTGENISKAGDEALNQAGEKISKGQVVEGVGQTVGGTANLAGHQVQTTVGPEDANSQK